MSYRLERHKHVRKDLAKLPESIQSGLKRAMLQICDEPLAKRRQVKPLVGHKPYLRLRLGDYRVIFWIDHEAEVVRVVRVGLRSNVYRGLDHLD